VTPHVTNGWLVVPCSGPELTKIEVGIQSGSGAPVWRPAFLDWEDGQRVAKVRTPAGFGARPVTVLVRVNGSETVAGRGIR
jgi:hypothetical protein